MITDYLVSSRIGRCHRAPSFLGFAAATLTITVGEFHICSYRARVTWESREVWVSRLGLAFSDMAFSVEQARAQFPALQQDQIFMDNAGGSQVLSTVIDSIQTYLKSTNV